MLNSIPFVDEAKALAPWAGVERATIKIQAHVKNLELTGRLIYADSPDKKRLLELNDTNALLLSHGKLLLSEELKGNYLKLLHAVIHEEIEAIMQIMAREDEYKYKAIQRLILKYFPPRKNEDPDLYLNHTIANAFELLILTKQNLVRENELTNEEKRLLRRIRSNKHNYFTGEFWDWNIRETKIRVALANGQRFYQVGGGHKRDPDSKNKTATSSPSTAKGKKRTYETRKVSSVGTIMWKYKPYTVGRHLAGKEIVLKPFDGESWDSGFKAFYGKEQIAYYDAKKNQFTRKSKKHAKSPQTFAGPARQPFSDEKPKPHAPGHVATFFERLYKPVLERKGLKTQSFEELTGGTWVEDGKVKHMPGPETSRFELNLLVRTGLAVKEGEGKEARYTPTIDITHKAVIEDLQKALSALKAKVNISQVQEAVRSVIESESHGGAIEVESEVGKGTKFTIKLPVQNKPVPPSGIKEVILNGKKVSKPEIQREMAKLSKGAHIFSFNIYDDGTVNFATGPGDGAHSELEYPTITFRGWIGHIKGAIDFKLETSSDTIVLQDAMRRKPLFGKTVEERYVLYRKIAQFFVEHGFPDKYKFGPYIKSFLETTKLEAPPRTLGELARQPVSEKTKKPPRGSPAAFIKMLYERFRNKKVTIGELAEELALSIYTVSYDASGFVKAKLITKKGSGADAVIEIILKDLDAGIVDEMKKKLTPFGSRPGTSDIEHVVREVLKSHEIELEKEHKIGDGTFQPMEDIPIVRKRLKGDLKKRSLESGEYREKLEELIRQSFRKIAQKSSLAFTDREMEEYSKIAANTLVRYDQASLQSLMQRGILSKDEASSIFDRTIFPADDLVKKIISILDNYSVVNITKYNQKKLLANFFTVEELELYKKLFPDIPISDILLVCMHYPRCARDILNNAFQTKRQMETEKEFSNVPKWAITRACLIGKDPRALLREVIRDATEISKRTGIPYYLLFKVRLCSPGKLRDFLISYKAPKSETQEQIRAGPQERIPSAIRRKHAGRLSAAEEKYEKVLTELIYNSLGEIAPDLFEKDRKDYSSIVAHTLVGCEKRSIKDLLYKGILIAEEANSISDKREFPTRKLAETIISIIDGYKKLSIGERNRKRLLANFYTADEIAATKRVFPRIPDYIVIRAYLNYPNKKIKFLRGIINTSNKIQSEEEFKDIPKWIIINACAKYVSNTRGYLRRFKAGKVKIFGKTYKEIIVSRRRGGKKQKDASGKNTTASGSNEGPFRFKIEEALDLSDISETSDEYKKAEEYAFRIFRKVNRYETTEANLNFSPGITKVKKIIESIIDEDRLTTRKFSSSLLPTAICYDDGQIEINSNFIKLVVYLRKLGFWRIKANDPIFRRQSNLLKSIVYSVALHEIRGHYKPNFDGSVEFVENEIDAQPERGLNHKRINTNAMLFYWLSLCENRMGENLKERVINFLEEVDEETQETYGDILWIDEGRYQIVAGIVERWSQARVRRKLRSKFRFKFSQATETVEETFEKALLPGETRRHSMNEGRPGETKKPPRGSPAKLIEDIYKFFRNKRVTVKDIAEELGLKPSTITRNASGFIEAGLITKDGSGENAVIEIVLKDLNASMVDEMKNKLTTLGKQPRAVKVKEIVQKVLRHHGIKLKVKRKIGDGTFQAMDTGNIPIVRNQRTRSLSATDEEYRSKLEASICESFKTITEESNRSFPGGDMAEYAKIAANTLVRYDKESLQSLVERDILKKDEATSIRKREELFSTDELAGRIIVILDNYNLVNVTEVQRKHLLSNFFTVEELELYKTLYPDIPTWDIYDLCRRVPNKVMEALSTIDKTSREMQNEKEFSRMPRWTILKACFRSPEDPRKLLRGAMKLADKTSKRVGDVVLPYPGLLKVCLESPGKLEDFLKPYIEPELQVQERVRIPPQEEIPVVIRHKSKRRFTAAERKYKEALEKRICKSLREVAPHLPEKETYASVVAEALLRYDKASLEGLVYRDILTPQEVNSILDRKRFSAEGLAGAIISIINGYKKASISISPGNRKKLLGHFYTADELDALKRAFSGLSDYLIIRACITRPIRKIEFLRNVVHMRDTIKNEEEFKYIPEWVITFACGHRYNNPRRYLRLFKAGKIKILGKAYKESITHPTPPGSEGPIATLEFRNAALALKETAEERYIAQAAKAEEQAASYGKSGQSLILYADDLLENAVVLDLESTVKNILAKHNVLKGGKIILFARNEANATILERMINRADSSIETVMITEKELREIKNINGSEYSEIKALVRFAKTQGAKDVLALIRGPLDLKLISGNELQQEFNRIADFSRENKVPIIIVGVSGKCLYSFAEAIAKAMSTKGATDADGWLIILEPIKPLSREIQKEYEEYILSLQNLQAA